MFGDRQQTQFLYGKDPFYEFDFSKALQTLGPNKAGGRWEYTDPTSGKNYYIMSNLESGDGSSHIGAPTANGYSVLDKNQKGIDWGGSYQGAKFDVYDDSGAYKHSLMRDSADHNPAKVAAIMAAMAATMGAAGMAAGGAAAAGGGGGLGGLGAGGAGGFIGEGALSGIGAWDAALASAPSWSSAAAGAGGLGSAMSAGNGAGGLLGNVSVGDVLGGISTIGGAVSGGKGQETTTTQSRDLPGYLQGPVAGNNGLINSANQLMLEQLYGAGGKKKKKRTGLLG